MTLSVKATQPWDAVVLGLGGVGSFALRALAQHAADTTSSTTVTSTTSAKSSTPSSISSSGAPRYLGIEQFSLGHLRGSSHGKTRLYRRAYFENPQYVPWIEYSLQQFRQLEQSENVSLLCPMGLLIAQDNKMNHQHQNHNKHTSTTIATPPDGSSSSSSSSSMCLPSYIQNSMDSAHQHNIPVELLQLEELKRRYPFLYYPPHTEYVGLLEPDAGFVRSEKAMAAALQEAKRSPHVTIWDNTNIVASSLQEHHCHVMTEGQKENKSNNTILHNNNNSNNEPLVELMIRRPNGTKERIITRKLLVSAGAWTSQLIPSWSPHLTVTRQLQMWINVNSDHSNNYNNNMGAAALQPNQMPGWFVSTPDHPFPIYGIPCDPHDEDAKDWIKVGIHGRLDTVQDPSQNPTVASPEEIIELQTTIPKALHSKVWSSRLSIQQQQPLVPDFCHIEPCMYTMTPDENFIIGVPKGFHSVCGVGGLSGHGFKMVPALGQMLADFAVGRGLDHWKADFCSPLRFVGKEEEEERPV